MADYKPVENMSNLYDKFYAKFAPSYKPQSASTLKDTLSRAMRPAYDKQITQRIDTGKANRGEIVASSTGSGMGTSTTMQDRLLKARDAEAKDIAGIESDYNAALYSALLNRMNAQDELSLTAENQARNTALGLAQAMYGQVYGAGGGGGGGYYYGRSPGKEKKEEEPPYDPFANKQVANAMFWGEGQANKAAAEQRAAANKYNNAVTSGNARTAAEKAKAAAQAAAQAKKKNAMYEMKSGNLSK